MHEFVSIIIPTFNMEQHINKCLDSLVNLNYPKDKLEIIVVDDGSTDNTVEIVKKYKVKLLTEQKETISKLRNLGARYAQGEILAFIDADCIASKDWLKNAAELLSKKGVGAIGCWYRISPRPSWVEKAWDIHMGRRRRNDGDINWVPSGNFIISQKIFNQVGGFNKFLITGEDYDICQRIRELGYKIFSYDKISVIHLGNPKNIKEFFDKQFWHGRGGLQMFLVNFPRLRFTKTILFALVVLSLSLVSFSGAIIWIYNGRNVVFLSSIILLLTLLLIMSIKDSIRSHNYAYLFLLPVLYFLFGFSRALSLLNTRIWIETLCNLKKDNEMIGDQ